MHASKEQVATLSMLTERSAFLAVQQHGQKWISRGLVLQVRENSLGCIRTGYTVTKKVDKRAVIRNRIKRRLRSVAADILPTYAKNGHDYILVGRATTQKRSYDDLLNDLKWCLRKIECYEKKQDG